MKEIDKRTRKKSYICKDLLQINYNKMIYILKQKFHQDNIYKLNS